MALGMQVSLDPGHIVLDGDAAHPPQKKGAELPSNFRAHFYCGQMAGWIKMPLDMEIGRGPGHIVQDGDPAPPPQKKGEPHPIFGPCLLWPNGWMDQDATWYGGPSSLSPKWDTAPPVFGPCLLWPNGWMDEDDTWYGSRPWLGSHCVR